MRNHRPFTKKQTSELLSNPYVASVTPCQIYYTLAFKKIFWQLYTEEKMEPEGIMKRLGFNIETVGANRIALIPRGLKIQLDDYGEFHEGRMKKATEATRQQNPQAVRVDPQTAVYIERMRHELDYVKQELKFIKKLFWRTERRSGNDDTRQARSEI